MRRTPALHHEEVVFADFFQPLCGAFAVHGVPVREFSAEDVGEYLGVAVRVCWEAGLWCDAVFV